MIPIQYILCCLVNLFLVNLKYVYFCLVEYYFYALNLNTIDICDYLYCHRANIWKECHHHSPSNECSCHCYHGRVKLRKTQLFKSYHTWKSFVRNDRFRWKYVSRKELLSWTLGPLGLGAIIWINLENIFSMYSSFIPHCNLRAHNSP